MASNSELLEAVNRLKQIEDEFRNQRIVVADLLRDAADKEKVTLLAQITGINRTTIYWLINTWSTPNGRNDD